MDTILTSDQFVAGIFSALALRDMKHFILTGTELDERFEMAFDDLVEHEEELGVKADFTFRVDKQHGDSVCLRDTLHAAKEKALITLNNPTFRTFDIKLSEERAQQYIKKIPLTKEFLDRVVETYFANLHSQANVRNGIVQF